MKRSVILTVFSLLALAQLALAQVAPQTISYQGVLRDKTTGDIVENADYNIVFTLYDNIGNSVWSEPHSVGNGNPVTVTDGVFNVILGKETSFSTITEPPFWLGIKVGADDEMIPRVELTSVIYALHADRSDSSDYARKAEEVSGADNVFPGSGNVGIGTTNPQTTLHVAQGDWILGSSGHSDLAESALLTSFAGILYEAGGSNWAHHFSAYEGGDIARFGISTGVGQAPDTRVVITKSGNVGIGTTAPSQKLDVDGTVLANGFALNNLNTKISSLTTDNIDLITNNAARVRVDPSGNVGIGTLAPSAKLDVVGNAEINGNLTVTGTTTIPATSRWYSIPASEFMPEKYNLTYTIQPYYIYPISGIGSLRFHTGVHLPDGAVIKEFHVGYDDSDATNDISVYLEYTAGNANGVSIIKQLTSSGSPGTDTMSNTLLNYTVNNSTNSYNVRAYWTIPATSGAIKLRNVRIRYEITTPLP